MPPSQSYKRRRVACQHSPDDQTRRLQTGAGEDDVIHLPSGLDRVDCEHLEEEHYDRFRGVNFEPSAQARKPSLRFCINTTARRIAGWSS